MVQEKGYSEKDNVPSRTEKSGQLSGEEYSMDSKIDGRVDTAARSKSDLLRASFMETVSHTPPPIPHEVPDDVYTSFHFPHVHST